MIHEALGMLVDGMHLTRQQASEVMEVLMRGESSPEQTAAFLAAMAVRGETIEEITGFAQVMRLLATKVPTSRRPLVDTCGTGGDLKGTFNISTTAAFVAAGAGVAVAKHGNRSASSKCGSADVLEALGVNLDLPAERVGQLIDDIGIGFLYARNLHGAMKNVAPIRQSLRIRTVFNVLGPLTNPANADGQVMGVYNRAMIEDLAWVLANLGVRHAFVVAGTDGLDEVTLAGPTLIAEARDGRVMRYEVTPQQFGLPAVDSSELRGGEAAENAEMLRGVLEGRPGPHRDIVVMNASPALQAGGAAADWEEGIRAAQQSIDSGNALSKLNALIEGSQ